MTCVFNCDKYMTLYNNQSVFTYGLIISDDFFLSDKYRNNKQPLSTILSVLLGQETKCDVYKCGCYFFSKIGKQCITRQPLNMAMKVEIIYQQNTHKF